VCESPAEIFGTMLAYALDANMCQISSRSVTLSGFIKVESSRKLILATALCIVPPISDKNATNGPI